MSATKAADTSTGFQLVVDQQADFVCVLSLWHAGKSNAGLWADRAGHGESGV